MKDLCRFLTAIDFANETKHMNLDPKKTALLTLDFQEGIFSAVPGSEAIVPQAARAVEFARDNHFMIIHVGLGFEEGHPEISDHSLFARVKKGGLFVKGTPSVKFHSSLVHPKDLVVYKQRVGGFSENQLHLILRANGIENLILMGIATSGIVLSTLRRAYDLDYRCTVIKDACFDRDPEVHRVLTDKVFAAQASVVTVDDFLAAQSN